MKACVVETWTTHAQLKQMEEHRPWRASALTTELLRLLHEMQFGPRIKFGAYLWAEQNPARTGRWLAVLQFSVDPSQAKSRVDAAAVTDAIAKRTDADV